MFTDVFVKEELVLPFPVGIFKNALEKKFLLCYKDFIFFTEI